MGDFEAWAQWLGLAMAQTLKSLVVPVHIPFLWGLFLLDFSSLFLVFAGFGGRLQIFDMMFRGLTPDETFVVEALASCSAGDLMEISHT